MENNDTRENERIEIALLLEAIYRKYSYDFKEYSMAHLKRRIKHRMGLENIKSVSELQHKVLYDSSLFERLLLDFSINISEMFRDPSFYRVLRTEVLPLWEPLPFIKIWHAGCASGQEVYSMVIMLKEEGLYDKIQVYGTDFNVLQIEKARAGIFPLRDVRDCAGAYRASGGKNALSDYYSAKKDSVIMEPSLKEKIVFADHNLVTDGVFGEMDMILCRNVLIYFTRFLQDRVLKLFLDSLAPSGFLCLGSKESVKFSRYAERFEEFSAKEKIFRRKVANDRSVVAPPPDLWSWEGNP